MSDLTPTHWWLRNDALNQDAVSTHGPDAAYYGSAWRQVMPVYTPEQIERLGQAIENLTKVIRAKDEMLDALKLDADRYRKLRTLLNGVISLTWADSTATYARHVVLPEVPPEELDYLIDCKIEADKEGNGDE